MKEVDVLKRNIGLNFNEAGECEAVVWNPEADTVHLLVNDKKLPLEKNILGYWSLHTDQIKPADKYKLVLNEKHEYPDPASLSQPEGVHGPSMVVDLKKFQWTDHNWKNHSLEEYILYELHTGCFSTEGNFEGIEKKLPHLKALGVNAIEIMPVAQFPGERNWGYDGVYPFAVQNSYGGAEGLQRLVNACHENGLAVILDVVYNHLGPEGNYLGAYGPYFTEKYKTPWGHAINFDDAWCDGVRKYFIENALMWFRDFHVDALRLDAVHAIKDFSPLHILKEIRIHTDALMKKTGRVHYLITELDLNDNRYINSVQENGYGMDAQWIDEFHHALRVTSGQERNGYYEDFNGIEHLAKAYKDAYVYDGQFSPHRKKFFGIKTQNEGKQFIVFSQNHDQVGNRMLGERTSTLLSFEMQKLLAAAVMVSPYLPMLFMGEEWSEPNPFLYFVSHTDPQLAEAVRKGRKQEFKAFHKDSDENEVPDPMAQKTFEGSKLQWDLLSKEPHQTMFEYYRALIDLRKKHPALRELNRKNISVEVYKEKNSLALRRWSDDEQVICFMNFSNKEQYIRPPADVDGFQKIFDSAAKEWMGKQEASNKICAGKQGSLALTMAKESVLIYSNRTNYD
jgi:maltooligosyltrehalose trehalohydrolase